MGLVTIDIDMGTRMKMIIEQVEPSDCDEGGIIPFADESEAVNEPASGAPLSAPSGALMSESAIEEFGTISSPARRSAVDQDLGLGGKQVASCAGGYSCPCCNERASRVMRVRVVSSQLTHLGAGPRWVAMCAVCAASMLARIPGTIVGGMVRPTRRRRPMRLQAAGVSRPEGRLGFRGRRDSRYRRAG